MHSNALKKNMFHAAFTASTLEQARAIEARANAFSEVNLVLRLYILVYRTLFNLVLRVLHFFWFSSGLPAVNEVRSIVVYVQGMLGDTAVHLPAIAALKKKYSTAALTVVSYSEGFPIKKLLEGLPYIDDLIMIADHPVVRTGSSLKFSDDRLRRISCDLFVNFSPYGNRGVPGFLLREMIFAHKLRAEWAVGFSLNSVGKRGVLNPVQHYFVKNEPRRSLEVLAETGISPDGIGAAFPVNADARASVARLLPAGAGAPKKFAVVNPGAKYAVNRWSAERFGEISRWLCEVHGFTVILNVAKNEMQLGEQVVAASQGTAKLFAEVLTIPELIELLRLASLCVTTFTGTMHLAALVNVPTVAIFPTRFSVTHWFPMNDSIRVLFNFNESSYSFDDTNDSDLHLDAITVRDVQASVTDLLSTAGR